ncbi:MMPL family transporter [Streptomyces polyrhachis]|uniref:MMPL family transporter n=1 Tax=Streptomyces polyrhachis TaxID=1282885 RepID=A0ABW2GHY7_9ACTN
MAAVESSSRRRGRFVPWTLLAMWVAVIALAGPFAGKLAGAEQDRAVDYLPASADSTQVAKVQDRLPGGEATELVVVYHRDGGLTAADRERAAAQMEEVAAAYELTAKPRAVPSKAGDTLMYPLASTEPGQDEEARDKLVEDVRATVEGGGGLEAEVGGSGGLQADMSEVFASLDGPLLYTTVAVVAVLLIVIYRSPVLWLVPLVTAGVANALAMAVTYGLHEWFGTTVTGQSTGVMNILVFGAGTDYALLLVSRYREELRRIERPQEAMRAALRGCGPAVVASSLTVAAGLLCLLAADLNSTRGMGPQGTVGVLSALLAMMTLLPALLVLLGRRVFWPLVPAFGSEPKQGRSLFSAMGASAGRRPLTVLVVGALVLGALALGATQLKGDLKNEDSFTAKPESIVASETLAAAFPDRGSRPVEVVVPSGQAGQVLERVRAVGGVAEAGRGRSGGGWTELAVTVEALPGSAGETAVIEELRGVVADGYVGGASAQQLDLADTSSRDRLLVIPLVLVSVLLILVVLLRSLVAPLILVAAVVAVWGAALGIGGLVFGPVFGFAGDDPTLPLLSFVFLVALGVDYGIFLMHRMREECLAGQEPAQAALTALRTTGGVIASAGVVLAATFSVLINMPLVSLVAMGFVIAVGVLLDTFLVRTYLVTSASVALGRRMWWPGALSKAPAPVPAAGERDPVGV